MNEFELIERIFLKQQTEQNALSGAQSAVDSALEKGIGDDAAVMSLPAGSRLVSCIDTLVQGRHFSADWDEVSKLAFQIGYKAVAVNVSDIAAMGATPHSILLALALPERLAYEQWLGEFAKGLFHACQLFGVTLIGGDTTRSDSLVLSVSAQGFLAAQTKAVYRSGAKVGDKIYVSGTIGDAAYALKHADNEIGQELAHRLHMPTPRFALGSELAQLGATAMIDISDGLYQDLTHICQRSNVGMRIDVEQLPTSTPLSAVNLSERLICQLTGGDDYELAFTLPAHIQLPVGNTPVHCIGEVVKVVIDSTINKDKRSTVLSPSLFYKGQAITQTNPAPFISLPTLTGYQHFTE